jgi:hypothetical protein
VDAAFRRKILFRFIAAPVPMVPGLFFCLFDISERFSPIRLAGKGFLGVFLKEVCL